MNVRMSSSPLMQITPRPEQVFVRGAGAYLYDSAGKRYLDWVQGWAVNCLGHAPVAVVEALTRQSAQLINPSPAFYNQPAIDLAAWLVAHSCFDQVFFASSGAEANEGAIKLARKWGRVCKNGASEIISFVNGFHGRTLATMAATGKPGWDTLFAPAVPGFRKAVYNDLESVRELLGPQTAAVMLEPVQGEAGVIPATREFMQGLRRLCDEQRVLLIVDEVQTGCGRTGDLFAYQGFDIQPDVMTLGKGIGGGVPLSALLARASACCFEYGDQGGTYCGNPLMCAVGLAVMETIAQPDFKAQMLQAGRHLRAALLGLCERFGLAGVRGSGLLLGLQLGRPVAREIVADGLDCGFLLNAPRADILRFMPALNITAAEINEGIRLLEKLLERQFPG